MWLPGDVAAQVGCSCPGDVAAWGVYLPKGMSATPPMDRMTDMCKNITFPQTSFVGGKIRSNINEPLHVPCLSIKCTLCEW